MIQFAHVQAPARERFRRRRRLAQCPDLDDACLGRLRPTPVVVHAQVAAGASAGLGENRRIARRIEQNEAPPSPHDPGAVEDVARPRPEGDAQAVPVLGAALRRDSAGGMRQRAVGANQGPLTSSVNTLSE